MKNFIHFIAGEKIEPGDFVQVGEDGLAYKARTDSCNTVKENGMKEKVEICGALNYKGKTYTTSKRNAKLGELVYITTGDGHKVPVGTIAKVTECLEYSKGWVRVKYKDMDFGNAIRDDQYVVLEPYKRIITVGDIVEGDFPPWYTFSDSHPCAVVPPSKKKEAYEFYGGGKKAYERTLDALKNCKTCKHTDIEPDKQPCHDCFEVAINDGKQHTKWEPKATPKKAEQTKRKWTDAEIAEAKRYVADKMYALTKEGKFIFFYGCKAFPNWMEATLFRSDDSDNDFLFGDKNTKLSATCVKTAIAKCCPTDTYNADIGKMVAVCKLFKEPYPSWMKGDK